MRPAAAASARRRRCAGWSPRPWGLAAGGEAGVLAVLRATLAELDLTIGLSGLRAVAEIGPAALSREPA